MSLVSILDHSGPIMAVFTSRSWLLPELQMGRTPPPGWDTRRAKLDTRGVSMGCWCWCLMDIMWHCDIVWYYLMSMFLFLCWWITLICLGYCMMLFWTHVFNFSSGNNMQLSKLPSSRWFDWMVLRMARANFFMNCQSWWLGDLVQTFITSTKGLHMSA